MDGRKGWAIAGLAFASNAVLFGIVFSFGTFFGPMAEEFGSGHGATALAFSITSATYFFTGAVTGPLSDRIGPRRLVLAAICIGVALFVGIGMARIIWQLPLLYVLLAGYGAVLALMSFTDREFVAIAVDAGGVATGPISNSFLLAFALGVSSAIGGQDPLVQGLGLVALIALAPIVSVMALGVLVRRQQRKEA